MQLVFNTKANLSQPCLSSLYATTIVAKQLTSFFKDDQSLQPQDMQYFTNWNFPSILIHDQSLQPQDMQYFTNWNFPSILILEVKQGQVEELLTYAVPIYDCCHALQYIIIFSCQSYPRGTWKSERGPGYKFFKERTKENIQIPCDL